MPRIRSLLLLTFMLLVLPQTALAQQSPPPNLVVVPGSLQDELGCPSEWQPECEETALTYNAENNLWQATFALPAGDYEYKVALNGSWDENYGVGAELGGANISLALEEDTAVFFYYDHQTNWIGDSVNSIIATVPGNFQDEMGCGGEWQPDCLRSLLQDPDGDGVYAFVTTLIPEGEYEAKVAINQSWDENYGAEGVLDGDNIPFSVAEGSQVTFVFDSASNVLEIAVEAAPEGAITSPDDIVIPAAGIPAIAPVIPQPEQVVVPGTIQSVLGCEGDWQPDCEATALAFDEEDALWTNRFTIPAGEYEYKAAVNGSWDVNFGAGAERGGANIALVLEEETAVTFYFDSVTGWITDDVSSLIANVPGDFQEEIGCSGDWQPDCLRSWLQDPDGDGTFVFQTTAIPAGSYEAKVAVGQSWGENYGEAGTLDGANIPFSVAEEGTLVTFAFDSGSKLMTISTGKGGGPVGNIREQRAHWVTANTIAWNVDLEAATNFTLQYSPRGTAFSLGQDGFEGGEPITLTLYEAGLSDEVLAKFPHLDGVAALKIGEDDLNRVRVALKSQTAVIAFDDSGVPVDATGLQIPGVIDDIYTYDGELGVTWEDGVPTVRVWAPTARVVRFHLFDDSSPASESDVTPMRGDPNTGVWTIVGEPDWQNKFYLFEVQVYVPGEGGVQTNIATDPYAISLSANSQRSQLVDLADTALMPDGWDALEKPALGSFADVTVYEMHIRDFSVNDPTVSADNRGKYLAFTETESNGMQHLIALAEAGLTHLHLLPAFDIATIEEVDAARTEPDFGELASLAADSDEQQALINDIRDADGFNWGYDPYHYTVPEGSYATDPDGSQRILEFRQMVQSLNENGLRVVMDVVYNHTNASGQSDRSVLDKIVPGYYHRLNARGGVERSTCCENTASEHNMMRKLMVDSLLIWSTAYKVDAYRFDLMGHHMRDDMLAVQEALSSLTVENDGVDGSRIFIYGEGWNFGEVANDARGINATQANMAGTGIGTFNDRLRDAVRGGSPFDGLQEQGFINGLYNHPNKVDARPSGAQLAELLLSADQIRVGLAGNLASYSFINAVGDEVTGADVDYNGSPAGYNEIPYENIVYISKHDNETLFDIIQFKAPLGTSLEERVRMQNLGMSIVSLSQGVPFFHAGSDMLRSKSLDRNSYNSGDWFNKLDFSYESNNWAVGLPPAADNSGNYEVMAALLAEDGLAPSRENILRAVAHFREMLAIRASSPLFRLETAVSVQERVAFHNTGPEQVPGVIVMSIDDRLGDDLDPEADMLIVVFNGTGELQTLTIEALAGMPLMLHPVQRASDDGVLAEAAANMEGALTVPGLTTAVFVVPQAVIDAMPVTIEETEEEPAPEPTFTPAAPAVEETADPSASSGQAVEEEEGESRSQDIQPTEPNGWLWVLGIFVIGSALSAAIATWARRE